MKLLVVDVGNTSTAMGLWTDGRVTRVTHVDGRKRFEIGGEDAAETLGGLKRCGIGGEGAAETLGGLKRCGGEDFGSLDGVAYVSVVPKADRAYKAAFKRLGLKVHQISYHDFNARPHPSTRSSLPSTLYPLPSTHYPLPSLSYPHPETIGADRLADAAGAVSRHGAPVLVMDFGTALTAAVVTEDRVWRGGVIAPGFPLMRDYLFERTAKLPRMTLGRGRIPKIGRSTEEAMRFGALVGYRGMVREIVAELTKNFKTDFRLVATGGFARWALRDIDLPFVVDPTLTLYGAGLIACERMIA